MIRLVLPPRRFCFSVHFDYLRLNNTDNVMKRVFLTIIALLAAETAAMAQEIKDKAAYTLNIERALWYGSGNAAGLARADAGSWRDVSLIFGLQSGAFTDAWGARSQTDLGVSGSTLMDLGGFKLAAGFKFDREHLRKASYNTSMFELSWDMPYYAALNSDETFNWGRTSAGVDLQAASPLIINDMLSLGLGFRVDLKRAAKNYDPRSRYNGFEMEIAPSASFAINGENIVGLSFRYILGPSKSRLYTKENDAVQVAIMQGLGNFFPRWAGGDLSIGSLTWEYSAFGAGLQYNRRDDYADWLFTAGITGGTTTAVTEKAGIGSVDKFITELSAEGIMGEMRNRKLSLDVKYNLNYWLNGSNTPSAVGKCHLIDSKFDYTVYTGTAAGYGFNWILGAGMDLGLLSAKRYVPDASLSSLRVMPRVFLGKHSALTQESSLLVRLDLGYNFAANTRYKYANEVASGNYIVNHMYDDEADYLGAYYFQTALDATYTYHLNTLLSPYASLKAGLTAPMGQKKSRLLAGICLGVMF